MREAGWSQVRGCYNIIFIFTNQETVSRLFRPESDALVPRQQLKLNDDPFLQGLWGSEEGAAVIPMMVM